MARPLNSADFRRLALSLPETSESEHMGHPDFRVRKKIFATLWPDDETGVVLVTPEEQAGLIDAHPAIFTPVKGGWGRRGSTQVRLRAADERTLFEALGVAWQRIAPRRLVAQWRLTFD